MRMESTATAQRNQKWLSLSGPLETLNGINYTWSRNKCALLHFGIVLRAFKDVNVQLVEG